MIDPESYPHGDVQTWQVPMGEDVLLDVPPELSHVVKLGGGDLHVATWLPTPGYLAMIRGYAIGGLLPAEAYEEATQPKVRLRDTISGLCYMPTDPLALDESPALRENHDLKAAAGARAVLARHRNQKAPSIDSPAMSKGVPVWLQFPIADYEVSSREQLDAVIAEISATFSSMPPFRRLWYRGQIREYPIERPAELLQALHFGSTKNPFPSLVPSLGRFARANPGKIDFAYAAGGPNHWWKKPFLLWVIRQNSAWLDHYPEFRARLEASLRDPDDMLFARLLGEMMLDPRVPTEVDDLRQWFFAFYKYSGWIWVLQQYGYLASMLDITTDCETALFFTQARMEGNRFSLPPPEPKGRVIYVFVQWKNSEAFWDTERISWGDDDWARELPPRVVRQSAGCLSGSTWFRQNFYGHLIVARIRIKGADCRSKLTVEEVFPGPDDDLLLRTLLDSQPAPEGLYW